MINPFQRIKKLKRYSIIHAENEVRLKIASEIYLSRNELKLNQSQLAKRAMTTQAVISRIENAEENVGIDLLQRIARSLYIDWRFGNEIIFDFSVSSTTQNFLSEPICQNNSGICFIPGKPTPVL